MFAVLNLYEPLASSNSFAFLLTEASIELPMHVCLLDVLLEEAGPVLFELWPAELETDRVRQWFKGNNLCVMGLMGVLAVGLTLVGCWSGSIHAVRVAAVSDVESCGRVPGQTR